MMPVKLLDESPADGGERVLQRLEAEVRTRLPRGPGRSFTPLRVQVRRLWENHYRVNVYVGGEGPTATIAHSFFLVADATGAVLASTPTMPGPKPAPAAG
jgi:hypothetical protein